MLNLIAAMTALSFVTAAPTAPTTGHATAQALCAEATVEFGCHLEGTARRPTADPDDPFGEDACRCEVKVESGADPTAAGVRAYALLTLNGHGNGGSVDGAVMLGVDIGGRWFLGPVLENNFKPGMGYVDNSGQIRGVRIQKLGAAGWGVIAETSNSHMDRDPGIENVTEDDTDEVHVCWNDRGRPTCATLTTANVSVDRKLEPEDMGMEDKRTDEEKAADDAERSEGRYALKVSFERGRVTIAAKGKDKLPRSVAKLRGKHSLSKLAKLEGVEVSRLE